MGFPPLQKGLCVTLCVLCFCYIFLCGVIGDATVSIGEKPIAETDENYVCATLDFWPPTKCNYGDCPWGKSSLLNLMISLIYTMEYVMKHQIGIEDPIRFLYDKFNACIRIPKPEIFEKCMIYFTLFCQDLDNKILRNAVKAFAPLRLRLGGTLQDRVVYQTKREEPCDSTFYNNTNKILDFTHACLSLDRWDEINSFIKETGAETVFGLNALRGKTVKIEGIIDEEGRYLGETTTAHGDWDYSNSKSLIEYTLNKGYKIHGWTLGNELGGRTLFIGVSPEDYAKDTKSLHKLVEEIYSDVGFKPLIIAPGAIFEKDWYANFIDQTPELHVATHHMYNLGSGGDDKLKETILTTSFFDEETKSMFGGLQNIIQKSGTKAVAWIGEAGGAFNSGQDGISNTFINGFWYLHMLGFTAIHDHKVFCRQTLTGGNYGLLGTGTLIPNPDYYSALLWHRLMGKTVLKTQFKGMDNVYTYAHCAKKSATGITILLLNQDGQNPLKLNLDSTTYGTKREEYHLTPADGNVQSRKVKLNGELLYVDPSGDIPDLKPVKKETSKEPILEVAPYSIVFVHLPEADLPACKQPAGK